MCRKGKQIERETKTESVSDREAHNTERSSRKKKNYTIEGIRRTLRVPLDLRRGWMTKKKIHQSTLSRLMDQAEVLLQCELGHETEIDPEDWRRAFVNYDIDIIFFRK